MNFFTSKAITAILLAMVIYRKRQREDLSL